MGRDCGRHPSHISATEPPVPPPVPRSVLRRVPRVLPVRRVRGHGGVGYERVRHGRLPDITRGGAAPCARAEPRYCRWHRCDLRSGSSLAIGAAREPGQLQGRRRLARRGPHDRCRRRGGVVAGRTRACNRTMGGNRHRCSGAVADGLFRWSLQTRRHLAQQGRGDIWSGWGRLYAGLGRHRERPEPLSPQAVHVVCAVLRLTTGHGEHRQIRWRVGRCILAQ